MKKLGKVLATFSARIDFEGMQRPKVDKLNLIKTIGIKNDKFANKDEKKQ